MLDETCEQAFSKNVCLLNFQAHKEEDLKYTDVKNELRRGIEHIRNQVLDMIATNSKVPEIEQLQRHEFNMDVEARQKLLDVREEKLKQVNQPYFVKQ